MKIGLKLWSTNEFYFAEAQRFWEENLIDFIEITAVIGSYEPFAPLWKSLAIPYVIHAPTFSHGVSFSQKEREKTNLKAMEEVFCFADLLQASTIIIHPGGEGKIEETIRQINLMKDSRLAIENKPYRMSSGHLSNGYLPEEIALIKRECGTQFCLDISHAICAANSLKKEHFPFLEQFFALKPDIYHVMDGKLEDEVDEHLHLGKGSYPLRQIISMIPKEALVTIETDKDSQDHLEDFEEDVYTFNRMID
ncbi:MAG: hypothetical protein S4CHLAM45_13660 [Chlamydiales bacterium]|nr:hypothetical protein [Chlamydiales bacterium]MCH9620470.1 hypothetical protein [Chlamydiales bacterium]MCH9623456.1 hypothetical protein [Chlamydiales bacterium]